MELIRFVCPQCAAPLPLPVGSFTKCKYCHTNIGVDDGTNAAAKGNATLVESLKRHSYLVPFFEQFSEAYYGHRDASSVIEDANAIETKLLTAYSINFRRYVLDPSPIDNILSDLYYMVTDVVGDVISSEELSVGDFENFKRQLFISGTREEAGARIDEDVNCRIHFPEHVKKKYKERYLLHWTGDALCAQKQNKIMGEAYLVTKGLIPTTAYLTRFLFFPTGVKDVTMPRLEFFRHRAISTKFLLSLLGQVVELRRNWMRQNGEIVYMFDSIADLFEPYRISKGFVRVKKLSDMVVMQNAIYEIIIKFIRIMKMEPVKRFTISL